MGHREHRMVITNIIIIVIPKYKDKVTVRAITTGAILVPLEYTFLTHIPIFRKRIMIFRLNQITSDFQSTTIQVD